MNLAKVTISPELLREALHLPADAQIKGAFWRPNSGAGGRGTIALVIDHPDLPKIPAKGEMSEVGFSVKSVPAPENSRPFITEFNKWEV